MAKSRSALILDIRSDSVGGAFVESRFDFSTKSLRTRVTKFTRQVFNLQEVLDTQRLFNELAEALKLLINNLAKDFPKRKFDRIECFLSAPFYAGQTRTIKQTYDKPTIITERAITKLINQDLESFERDAPPLYREIVHDAHEIIERKVMQIKLNRYLTCSPYGKTAREISIDHYVSVSSKQILSRLREIISTRFDPRKMRFHSFPFVFFSLARDYLGAENVFLLDIGGEVTELSLIAGGILWETASFPHGYNFLARLLAANLKTTSEEALSSLKLYGRGDQNKETSDKIGEAITSGRSEWLSYFKEALTVLTEEHLGSDRLLAIGLPDVSKIFLNWLGKESFSEYLFTGRSLRAGSITQTTLEEGSRRKLPGPADDQHLLLSSVFYDKLITLSK